MVLFSIICLLVMIVFFCIYSIRSMKVINSYGSEYYEEGVEKDQMQKMEEKKADESADYVEFKDLDTSSDYDKSKDKNSEKDSTFEKVY